MLNYMLLTGVLMHIYRKISLPNVLLLCFILIQTIEKFLSKDINYIVSNRSEAKFAQTQGKNSPVPSPDSVQNTGNTSPHPSSRRESNEGSSHRTLEMVCKITNLLNMIVVIKCLFRQKSGEFQAPIWKVYFKVNNMTVL